MIPKICGYSERGVINSIVYCTLSNPELSTKFIEILLRDENFDVKGDITFYVEQSLSDFGDPDLMIKVGDSLIFVEAKVKTCSDNWKGVQTELKKYNDSDNPTSNLFRQLKLKECFVKNYNFAKSGIKTNDPKIQGNKKKERKIGRNKVVLKAFDDISECLGKEKVYYVAIVPDSKEKIEAFEKSNEFKSSKFTFIHFVSWEEIKEKLAPNYKLINETFDYNEGQIF